MKHMVRGFVCLAIAAGVSLAALAEEPDEDPLQLELSFSDSEAVVTVPASEFRVPMKVRLAWGEGKGVDIATVTATGGVFRISTDRIPVVPGTKVHAELVSAYDVVEYVESHGAEYVPVGTELSAGIRVSVESQFTKDNTTQIAWGFSSSSGCWFGCQNNKYLFGGWDSGVSVLTKAASSVSYASLSSQHAEVGSASKDLTLSLTAPASTLTIFAAGATPGFFASMKLWSFAVENLTTAEKVADLVPVRKGSIGALYDLVNGVLCESPSGELSCGGETVSPAGRVLGASDEVTYEGKPLMSLVISGIDAVVTVPANEFRRVPMMLRLVWGETESADVAFVTARGGVFSATLGALGISDGTKVHAELVSAYDVVEYVESHGTEYVDVGTELVAGIKVSMGAQFTEVTGTHTAWGFSAGGGCWLGCSSSAEGGKTEKYFNWVAD